MGRKVKDHIYWEGKKLFTTFKGKEVRVAFDEGYGKKGGYRLYVDNEKVAQGTSIEKIVRCYYDYIDENKTIEYTYVKSHEKILRKITKDKSVPNKNDIDTSSINEKIAAILSNNDGHLDKHDVNWDSMEGKMIIEYFDVCEKIYLELKTGKTVIETPPSIQIKKQENLSADLQVNELHRVDRDYIIQEFVKLLRADKHSVAALAGIPQLACLDESSIPKKRELTDDPHYASCKKHIKNILAKQQNEEDYEKSAKMFFKSIFQYILKKYKR